MASSQTLFGPDSDSGRGGLGRGHYSSSRSSRDDGNKIRGGFNHFSDVFRYEYEIDMSNFIILRIVNKNNKYTLSLF
mgnify:CR=1 FL=1